MYKLTVSPEGLASKEFCAQNSTLIYAIKINFVAYCHISEGIIGSKQNMRASCAIKIANSEV